MRLLIFSVVVVVGLLLLFQQYVTSLF